MLTALKNRGYHLVILSNCKASYREAHWEEFGMERWFDRFYDCESYGFLSLIHIQMCIRDRHEIIYMNPAAVISYAKGDGDKLIGRSLLECHNPESRDKIQQVVDWFAADESHNIVYTFHNEKQNKDVYMAVSYTHLSRKCE